MTPSTPRSDEPVGKIQILLVDDERDQYEIMRRMLAKIPGTHYHLDWTSEYEDGLKRMCENSHHVAIIDFRLGARTGIDLLKEARSKGATGPIIVITGQGNLETDLEAMQSGADDYLIKSEISPYYLDKSIRFALEKRRSEKLLVGQQIKLSQAMKMSSLGEMASGIAHEINNPLAIVAGRTAQLKKLLESDDFDKAKASELLDKLAETTDRMTRIVKTMRGFVRKDDAPNNEPVRLKAVISDAQELCQGKLRHAGAVLEVPDVALDLAVIGNHSEILQVLLNTICNAIEAVELQAERWVKLEVVEIDKMIEIRVSDSGPGIPQDVRSHMTEAFFTTKVSGTGLGLSICRMIAERHRGYFRLSPDAEQTTFVFGLQRASLASKATGIRRILVVDDEPEIVKVLVSEFQRQGYDVLKAHDGIHALDVLLKTHVDLLITDYNMPGIDGLTLYRKVRAAGGDRAPKVIFITGYDPQTLRSKMTSDDGVSIFGKPFSVSQMMSVIQQWGERQLAAPVKN
jgi:signal transduction histidine kinase